MPRPSTQTRPEETVPAVLRAATTGLHQRLHENPLIVGLLTSPSLQGYRAVLEGFYRFYIQTESTIVKRTWELGFAEQYSRVVRTKWLAADLAALGREPRRAVREHRVRAEIPAVTDLVGVLYVVHGSALGGRSILHRVTSVLSVERACRFLNADGGPVRQTWNKFQRFAEEACCGEEAKRIAIGRARQTFTNIERCLSWCVQG